MCVRVLSTCELHTLCEAFKRRCVCVCVKEREHERHIYTYVSQTKSIAEHQLCTLCEAVARSCVCVLKREKERERERYSHVCHRQIRVLSTSFTPYTRPSEGYLCVCVCGCEGGKARPSHVGVTDCVVL